MNKAVCRIFLLFLTIFLYINLYAATDNVNTSPYDVIYNYFHFLKKGSSYDELQASRSFDIPNKRTRIEATLKLKEILDSKVDPSKILEKTPDNPSYIDTITKKNIYVLYDKLPQIYLEQKNGKWYFSPTTVDAIPDLHKKIFPFQPIFGQSGFLDAASRISKIIPLAMGRNWNYFRLFFNLFFSS